MHEFIAYFCLQIYRLLFCRVGIVVIVGVVIVVILVVVVVVVVVVRNL